MIINTTPYVPSKIKHRYGKLVNLENTDDMDRIIKRVLSMKPEAVICDPKEKSIVHAFADEGIQVLDLEGNEINQMLDMRDLWYIERFRKILAKRNRFITKHEVAGCLAREYENNGAENIKDLLKSYYGKDIGSALHITAAEIFIKKGFVRKITEEEYWGINSFKAGNYIFDAETCMVLVDDGLKPFADKNCKEHPDIDFIYYKNKFDEEHRIKEYKSGPYYKLEFSLNTLDVFMIMPYYPSEPIMANIDEAQDLLDKVSHCPGFQSVKLMDKYGECAEYLGSGFYGGYGNNRKEQMDIAVEEIDELIERAHKSLYTIKRKEDFTGQTKEALMDYFQIKRIIEGQAIFLTDIDKKKLELWYRRKLKSIEEELIWNLQTNPQIPDRLRAYAYRRRLIKPLDEEEKDYFDRLLWLIAYGKKEVPEEWKNGKDISEEKIEEVRKWIKGKVGWVEI